MTETQRSFEHLMDRVRQGDRQAAEELIRRYEPELRVIARVRLTDPALRRVMDSMDICQSIMVNFLARATAGQFELDSPQQLLRLLSTMVRNKVTDLARRAHRARRDSRRLVPGSADEMALSEDGPTPSGIVAQQELVAVVQQRLSAEELQIAVQRSQGCDWNEIAAQTGSTPEAVRKRFTRAMERVARELERDEVTNE